MQNIKQILDRQKTDILQELLTFCSDNDIDKQTLRHILGLHNRLADRMQDDKKLLRVNHQQEAVIITRCNHLSYPITII